MVVRRCQQLLYLTQFLAQLFQFCPRQCGIRMLINIVGIIVLQLYVATCFNFPCKLHHPFPFSMSPSWRTLVYNHLTFSDFWCILTPQWAALEAYFLDP